MIEVTEKDTDKEQICWSECVCMRACASFHSIPCVIVLKYSLPQTQEFVFIETKVDQRLTYLSNSQHKIREKKRRMAKFLFAYVYNCICSRTQIEKPIIYILLDSPSDS